MIQNLSYDLPSQEFLNPPIQRSIVHSYYHVDLCIPDPEPNTGKVTLLSVNVEEESITGKT